jgi:hypothetical protein
MSSAKKHHFVPQMLLRRFADDKEKLTVHRLDRADAHTASVRDLGHRNQGQPCTSRAGSPTRTSSSSR